MIGLEWEVVYDRKGNVIEERMIRPLPNGEIPESWIKMAVELFFGPDFLEWAEEQERKEKAPLTPAL